MRDARRFMHVVRFVLGHGALHVLLFALFVVGFCWPFFHMKNAADVLRFELGFWACAIALMFLVGRFGAADAEAKAAEDDLA